MYDRELALEILIPSIIFGKDSVPRQKGVKISGMHWPSSQGNLAGKRVIPHKR